MPEQLHPSPSCNTKPRKILLLSVSAGAGHTRAAQALCAYAREAEHLQTLHLDVMNYVPKTFRRIYIDTYIQLVQKLPTLWGMLYKSTDKTPPQALRSKLRRLVERLNTRALTQAIADFAPDAIICTHFLPAEILMHQARKNHLKTPVWVQITDFDLHRMWLIPHMRGFFTANDEVAFRLQQNGIASERIHITGIPVMPAFSRKNHQPARTVASSPTTGNAGLPHKYPVLLLMGGGAGLGGLDTVAAQLLEHNPDIQLIALAGKNAKALTALQKLAQQFPDRLFPQGFTDRVEEIMACADLVITKPGGLTSSECLAMGLPMIVHAPIPGQEEHNADYLLEQGAALKAIDELGLIWRVRQLMANPEQLAQMRNKARKLGKPHAARDVISTVMQDLDNSTALV